MAEGIIMRSMSPGATQEDIEKVFVNNGLEVDKPELAAAEEPKREDFDSDEEFAAAQVEHEEKAKAATKPKESDEEDETEEEEEPAQPTKPTKKPNKFRLRVNKLAESIAAQKVAKLERELAELKKGTKQEPEIKEEPKKLERPKRADFTDDDKYEDALLAWHDEQRKTREAAEAQRASQEETLTNYRAQVEEFKAEHDDWDEVVGNSTIKIPQGAMLAIIERENGAAVVYHLSTHPEEAKKLMEMSEVSAIVEVGRLSDKLEAVSGSPAPGSGRGEPPKPKPRVPPPVRTVNTAATSSTLTSHDAAERRDYKAFKAAQRAGR